MIVSTSTIPLFTSSAPRDIIHRYEKIRTLVYESEYQGVQYVADLIVRQIYRGGMDNDEMFQKISDTLTAMATRGESNE